MIRLLLCLLPAVALFPFVAAGQDQSPDEQERSTLRLRAASSVLGRYEAGRWSALNVNASNIGDQDQLGKLAVYFEDEFQVQFARQLWVPAGAVRQTWLPVLLPERLPADAKVVNFSAFQLASDTSGDVVRRLAHQQVILRDALILDRESIKTAMLFDQPLLESEAITSAEDRASYEVIIRSRQQANLSRVTVDLNQHFMPPAAFMLDTVDQMVLASDRVLQDSAGMQAIRNWLRSGGKLWVMVDRIEPETARRLLGDVGCYEIVDRVQLNEFTVLDRLTNSRSTWSSETPVELVRVLADSADVHAEIDGWPAAFWQPFGDGEVVFTTLAPAGWLSPKVPYRESETTTHLASLAVRFYADRKTQNLPVEETKTILQEKIGYRIPRRGVASSLLTLHCLGLLAAGVVLLRRRRLEHLAWVVPLLTLSVAGVLLGIGWAHTQRVPPSATALELVRTIPHSREAAVSGHMALYSQEPTPLPLESLAGGVVVPDFAVSSASTKRMVWNDDGRSQWVNFQTQPGSVRFVRYHGVRPLKEPLVLRARFGADGLEGRLTGGDGQTFEDLIIAAPPAPALAIALETDGQFASGPQHVLSRNQFLADTLLSDEQRRRQMIYRQLLTPGSQGIFPKTPTLFGWQPADETNLELGDAFQQGGVRLTSIGLELERTPPDAPFTVPATFVRIESYRGKYGASTVFNPRLGQWMEDSMRPTITELRFRLPEQVLPCRLDEATLTIKINAPSRAVRITKPGDETLVLREYKSPSGVVTLTFDDPGLLEVDELGGVLFGIEVTQTTAQLAAEAAAAEHPTPAEPSNSETDSDTQPLDNSTWQIDYVRLDVRGTTSPAP